MSIHIHPGNEITFDPAAIAELIAGYYHPTDTFLLRVDRVQRNGSLVGSSWFLPALTDLTSTFADIAADHEAAQRDTTAAMVNGQLVFRHRLDPDPLAIRGRIEYRPGGIGGVYIYDAYGQNTTKAVTQTYPNAFTRILWKTGVGETPWTDPPGVLVLSNPIVETLTSGWDQMRERLLVPFSPYFAPGQRRDHMLDERAAPFAHLLSQEERVVGFHGPWPIVELVSLGFAREKPWIIQLTQDTNGSVGTGEGVTRNLPTITLTWFSDVLESTKLVVPVPAVPPETFDWWNLSVTSDAPGGDAGWIIIKRDVDPLPVITGSTPQAQPVAGNVLRANANLHPRPTLCKVIDYYVYDPLFPLPPNN